MFLLRIARSHAGLDQVWNLKQWVPITSKSMDATHYNPKISWVPGTLGTCANSISGKGKAPVVPFHGIISPYRTFEFT